MFHVYRGIERAGTVNLQHVGDATTKHQANVLCDRINREKTSAERIFSMVYDVCGNLVRGCWAGKIKDRKANRYDHIEEAAIGPVSASDGGR